jgi:hypothetical protein
MQVDQVSAQYFTRRLSRCDSEPLVSKLVMEAEELELEEQLDEYRHLKRRFASQGRVQGEQWKKLGVKKVGVCMWGVADVASIVLAWLLCKARVARQYALQLMGVHEEGSGFFACA